MRMPSLQGEIERRLLVNYRVEPDVVGRILPAPFRPQLVNGYAVAGICLIRLADMRPPLVPQWVGLGSENAAHRIAVDWETPDGPRSGVYIPRRDSNSMVNVLVGGRLFPGDNHRAAFTVDEQDDRLDVGFVSRDRSAAVRVRVRTTDRLEGSRVFADVAAASAFFEAGSLGYSATHDTDRFDGLALETQAWKVEPVEVVAAHSTFFEDRSVFPSSTVQLDNALLMRRIPVRWRPVPTLTAGPFRAVTR